MASLEVIKWDESLATGIECVDNQHREMLRRINGLIAAMNGGKGKGEIAGLFVFLDAYVVEHFATEREYMSRYRYPDAAAHLKEHDFYAGEVAALRAELERDGASTRLVVHAKRRLLEWYLNHIGEVDRRMAAYIKERL